MKNNLFFFIAIILLLPFIQTRNFKYTVVNQNVYVDCVDLGDGETCDGNFFIKFPYEDEIKTMEIDENGKHYFTYSLPVGVYQFYYTDKEACIVPDPTQVSLPIEISNGLTVENVSTEDEFLAALSSKANNILLRLQGDIVLKKKTSRKVSKNIVLDLNGKTIKFNQPAITGNSAVSMCPIFYIVTKGNLTVTGEGTLDSRGSGEASYVFTVYGGMLTVYSGTFIGDVHAIYGYKNSDVYIKGGTFVVHGYPSISNPWSMTLNCYDASYLSGICHFLVTGGRFQRFNPEISGEKNHPSFVASGYSVETKEDTDIVDDNASMKPNESQCITYIVKKDPVKNIVGNEVSFTLHCGVLCDNPTYYIVSEDNKYEEFINVEEHEGAFYPSQIGKYFVYSQKRNFILDIFEVKSNTIYVDSQCTLQDAIKNSSEQIIKVINDFAITNIQYTIENAITLDLNSKTITSSSDPEPTFTVKNQTTIIGDGEIDSSEKDNLFSISESEGNLIIESGSFIAKNTIIDCQSGNVLIKGGYFESKIDPSTMINKGDNGNVIIVEGTFSKYRPDSFVDSKSSQMVSGNEGNQYYTIIQRRGLTLEKDKYFKEDTVIFTCKDKYTNQPCAEDFDLKFQDESDEVLSPNGNQYSFTASNIGTYNIYTRDKNILLLSIPVGGSFGYFNYTQSVVKENQGTVELINKYYDFSKVIAMRITKNDNNNIDIIQCQSPVVLPCFSIAEDSNSLILSIDLQPTDTFKIVSLSSTDDRIFEKDSPTFTGSPDNVLKTDLIIQTSDFITIHYASPSSFNNDASTLQLIDNNQFLLGDIIISKAYFTDTNKTTMVLYGLKVPSKINDLVFKHIESPHFTNYAQSVHFAYYYLPGLQGYFCAALRFDDYMNPTTNLKISTSTNNMYVIVAGDTKQIKPSNGEIVLPITEQTDNFDFNIYYNNEFYEKRRNKDGIDKLQYIDNRPIIKDSSVALFNETRSVILKFKEIIEGKHLRFIYINHIATKKSVRCVVHSIFDNKIAYYCASGNQGGESEYYIRTIDNQCGATIQYYIINKLSYFKYRKIDSIGNYLYNKRKEDHERVEINFNVELLDTIESIRLVNTITNQITTVGDVNEDASFMVPSDISNGIYDIQFDFTREDDLSTENTEHKIYVFDHELIEFTYANIKSSKGANLNTIEQGLTTSIPSEFLEFYYSTPSDNTKIPINGWSITESNQIVFSFIREEIVFSELGDYTIYVKDKIRHLQSEEDEYSFTITIVPQLTFNRYLYVSSLTEQSLIISSTESEYLSEIYLSDNKCTKDDGAFQFICSFYPGNVNIKKEINIYYEINSKRYSYAQQIVIYPSIEDIFDITLTPSCLFSSSREEIRVSFTMKEGISSVFDISKYVPLLEKDSNTYSFTSSGNEYILQEQISEIGEYTIGIIENEDISHPLLSTLPYIQITGASVIEDTKFITEISSESITFNDLSCMPSTFNAQINSNGPSINCEPTNYNAKKKEIKCSFSSISFTSFGSNSIYINDIDISKSINIYKSLDKHSSIDIIPEQDVISYPDTNTISITVDSFDNNYISSVIVTKKNKTDESIHSYAYTPQPSSQDLISSTGNYFAVTQNSLSLPLFINYNEDISISSVCQSDYKSKVIEVSTETELTSAITTASDGDTIRLMNDIDISIDTADAANNVYSTITLDMNGKRISYTHTLDINCYALRVRGGHLTITGNGEIDFYQGGLYGYAVRVDDGGSVTIENGVFRGNTSAVYVRHGDAYINGGYYEVFPDLDQKGRNPYGFTLNCYDSDYRENICHFYVKGGMFYRYNPQKSDSESDTPNWVVNGYQSEGEGDNGFNTDNIYTKTDNEVYIVNSVYVKNTTYLQGDVIDMRCPSECCYISPSVSDCKTENSFIASEIGKYEIKVNGEVVNTITVKEKIIDVIDEDTLHKAIKNSINGQVIKILNDIIITNDSEDAMNIIKKDISIDLNGMTITTNKVLTVNTNVFYIEEGHLTIIGNGIIDVSSCCSPLKIIKGSVDIESGTFKGLSSIVDITEGDLQIKGGYYEVKEGSSIINGGNVLISNGQFVNYDPTEKISQGFNVANNNNVYTVSPLVTIEGNDKCTTGSEFKFTIKESSVINENVKIKFNNEVIATTINEEGAFTFTPSENGKYEIYYSQDDSINILPVYTIKCTNEFEYQGPFAEDNGMICYTSNDIKYSIDTFEFGITEDVFFFKAQEEYALSFDLDFNNELSANQLLSRVKVNNDDIDERSILECIKDRQNAHCSITLYSLPLQLNIGLIGLSATKSIYISKYYFTEDSKLCQTKSELNPNTDITFKVESPISFSSITLLPDTIKEGGNNDNVYSFTINPSDIATEGDIMLQLNYKVDADSEEKTHLIEDKIQIKKELKIVKVDSQLKTDLSQNFVITFEDNVDKESIKEILLELSDDDENSARTTSITIDVSKKCLITEAEIKCIELDLSQLAEGNYLISYKDSCDSTIKTNSLLFIEYIDIPQFTVSRHYFTINKNANTPNASPSITVISLNVTEDITLYIQKEGDSDAPIKIEPTVSEGQTEHKWSYDFTNYESDYKGTYKLYYTINDAEKHLVPEGSIIILSDINDVFTIQSELCMYYKDRIALNLESKIEGINYDYLTVYLKKEENNQYELIKEENSYVYSYDFKDNEASTILSLYIVDNSDDTSPLLETQFTLTNLVLQNEYIFDSSSSLIFIEATCKPNSLSFTIDDTISIQCTEESSLADSQYECKYSKSQSFTQFGKEKSLLLDNTAEIGKIFVSKELTEGTITVKKLEGNEYHLVDEETNDLYGEYTIQISSDDYYLSLSKANMKYEGKDDEEQINCDAQCINKNDNTMTFKISIGYNDKLTLTTLSNEDNQFLQINKIFNGLSFSISDSSKFNFITTDSTERTLVPLTFNIHITDSEAQYTIKYDDSSIPLSDCSDNKDGTYTCEIEITSEKEIYFYINDSINTKIVNAFFIIYQANNQCQSLFNAKSIDINVQSPSTFAYSLEVSLASSDQSQKITSKATDNGYTFDASSLSSSLSVLLFKVYDGKTELYEYTDSSLITLYEYYAVKSSEITEEIKLNKEDNTNYKEVIIALQFEKNVQREENEKSSISIIDKDDSIIASSDCSFISASELSCKYELSLDKSGEFTLRYKDQCEVEFDFHTITLKELTIEVKYTLANDIIFIDSDDATDRLIEIEVNIEPSEIYIASEQQVYFNGVLNSNCQPNGETKKLCSYEVNEDDKVISITMNNDAKTEKKFFIGRISFNKQCNTLQYSSEDISLSLSYSELYTKDLTLAIADTDKVLSNESSVLNGEKTITAIISESDLSSAGEYEIVIKEGDNEIKSTKRLIVTIYEENVINKIELQQYNEDDNKYQIVLEFTKAFTDKPEMTIENKETPSLSFATTCDIDSTKVLCSFALGEKTLNDILGTYSLSYYNLCDAKITPSLEIPISLSGSITLVDISERMIQNGQSTELVLSYSESIVDKITSVSILNKDTEEILFAFSSDSFTQNEHKVTVTIPSSNDKVGVFYIQSIISGFVQNSFKDEMKLTFYNSVLEIYSIHLDTTEYKPSDRISIKKGTKIDSVTITFTDALFDGRLTSLTKNGDAIDYITSLPSSIIISTSDSFITSTTTFLINDITNSSPLTVTINVDSDDNINIEHFIFLYTDTKPTVKISTSPSITSLYYISNGKYIKMQSNDNANFYYEPSNRNEEIYFSYTTSDDNRIDTVQPVYIFDNLENIIDISISNCVIAVNGELTITKIPKAEVKIDMSHLTFKLFNSNNEEISASNDVYVVSTAGKFVLKAYRHDINDVSDVLIYTKEFTVTAISFDDYVFTSITKSAITLRDMKCLPSRIAINSVVLTCTETLGDIECNFDEEFVSYGENAIEVEGSEKGKVYIYKTLSEANINLVLPTYPVGKVKVAMSTSQYDLALINKVEVDNEEIAYEVDGDLLFECDLSDKTSRVVTISSKENNEEKKRSFTINAKDLKYSISPIYFLLASNDIISFDISFESSSDLSEYIDKIYIDDSLISCQSSSLSTHCEYQTSSLPSSIEISINKQWKKSIYVIKYTNEEQCPNNSNEIIIRLQSTINLRNIFSSQKGTLSCDSSGSLFDCQIVHSSAMSIKKGEYYLQDAANNKYILNDVQFDILEDKSLISNGDKILYSNIDSQFLSFEFINDISNDGITSIYLYNSNSEYVLPCEPQSKSNAMKCRYSIGIHIPIGTYSIAYKNKCSKKVSLTGTVNVIEASNSYQLTNNEPISAQSNKTVTLEFKGSEDSTAKKVTLMNINDNSQSIVVNNPNNNGKVTSFTINTDNYGKYSLSVIDENDSEIPVIGMLTLYDKELKFKESDMNQLTLYVVRNKKINAIVEFDNVLFANRVTIEGMTFTINSPNITFIKEEGISSEVSMTINDISGTSLSVTFVPFDAPMITISPEVFVMNKDTALNVMMDRTDAKFIDVKVDNGIIFTLSDNQIKSSSVPSVAQSGSYHINFYYSQNDFISSSNVVQFVNKNQIPSSLTNTTIYVESGATSFIIELNQQLSPSLLPYVTLSNVNSISQQSPTSLLISTSPITDASEFTLNLISSEIKINVLILTCTSPSFIHYISSNNTLLCATCRQIDSSRPYFISANQCVAECPKGRFTSENYECLLECPDLYEDTRCVSQCSDHFGLLFPFSKECLNCEKETEDKIAIDGYCESECMTGALVNKYSACLLPEKLYEEFQSGKCDDYCKHDTKCTLKNNNPYCECGDEFYGPACEIEKEDAETYIKQVDENLFPVYNENNNKNEFVNVRIGSTKVTYEIKQMVSYSMKNENYIKDLGEDKKKIIIASTNKILSDIKSKTREPNQNMFHLIGLALRVHINNLKQGRLRHLDTSSTKEEIKQMLNDANEALKLLSIKDNKLDDSSSVILSDDSMTIFYQYSKATALSLKEREINTKNNNLNVIDFNDCLLSSSASPSDTLVVSTDITSELKNVLNDDDIPSTLFTVIDKQSSEEIPISDCNVNIKFALPSTMNLELYNYYISKGIDIYNPKDEAFDKKCYHNKEMDFDMPVKYRREYLYQQKTLTSEGCTRVANENGYVIMKCPLSGSLNVQLVDAPLSKINEKTSDVPIRCANDIDDIVNNIAFWIYLVIFAFIISLSVVYLIFRKHINTNVFISMKNDDFIKEISFCRVPATESVEQAKPKAQNEDKISFISVLFNTFMEIHPITSTFRLSIITPTLMQCWLFAFNVMTLFGFNALYFSSSMLEDRMFDSFRNNFGYVMKSEFDKVMSAIASSIVLTVIAKAIILVTYRNREELGKAIENNKNVEEIKKEINKFHMSMLIRRILGIVFCAVIGVFFFYYCVVFCGVFVNTQLGWLYSGIWTLMVNWVVLANVFIVIVAIVEYNTKNKEVTYYLKRLFIF